MPAHVFGIDSDRHPPKGASTATSGQVIVAGGADATSWVTMGGDVSGTPAASTVTDLTISGEARGDILYRGASAWLRLAAGTSGQVLQTAGAGADPAWATVATGALTGTTNLSWTINSDAAAGVAENPFVRIKGGDGVAAPNDDLVFTDFIQDSVREETYVYQERARNGGASTRIAPIFSIGLPNSTANFGAALRFNGGSGSVVITEDLTLSANSGAALLTFSSQVSAPGAGSGSERWGKGAVAAGTAGTACGPNASAAAANTWAGASSADATASGATVTGAGASGSASNVTVYGSLASATVASGIAVGRAAVAGSLGVIISDNATLIGSNYMQVGSVTLRINTLHIGSIEQDGGYGGLTWAMVDAAGSNIAGQNTTVKLARGTGTGIGGHWVMQAAPAGSSSSTRNTLGEVFRITDTAKVGIGNVGASPSGDLHLLRNTASAATILIDQDGAGDAYIRFDAGAETWICGNANTQSDRFGITESSGFGTTDRWWIEPNGGAMAFLGHTPVTGEDEAFQIVTRTVTVTNATITTIWAKTISDRYAITAFAIIAAQSNSATREGASYMRAGGARMLNGGAIALLGASTDLFTGEDDAVWDAAFTTDGVSAFRLQIKGNDTDSTTFVATICYQTMPL